MSHDVRLIDANQLIQWIETNKANTNPLDYNTRATYAECITMVSAMKTIDAEPVRHGHWIPTRPYLGSTKCSICGKVWGTESPHCPSCGAKMDEGGQNATN